MKTYFIAIFLFLSLNVFSQTKTAEINDTIPFSNIPNVLRKDIDSKMDQLLYEQHIDGELETVSDGANVLYKYIFYIQGETIIGSYKRYGPCASCWNNMTVTSVSPFVFLYCCKDPRHKPKETARIRTEIERIQRKKGCSKIGICRF